MLEGVIQLFVPARSLLADPLATVVDDIVVIAAERRVPITLTGLAADEVDDYGARAFLERVEFMRPDAVIFAARDHARLGLDPGQPVRGSGSTVVMGLERTAVISEDGVEDRRTSPPVTVVDRTGATDGFVAGYLMSRRAGASPGRGHRRRPPGHVAGDGSAGPTTQGDPVET